MGLLTAIYLSEYAPQQLRRWLKPALEILAGVPTVVYGYFALTFITPFFRDSVFPGIGSFNALSAGLIMGVMIIPTVASVSEDAIYAVPRSLAGGRLRARRDQARDGDEGRRAGGPLGDRGGGDPRHLAGHRGDDDRDHRDGLPAELRREPPGEHAGDDGLHRSGSRRGDAARSITYKSIFAVGSALFLMTLALNLASYWFVRRYRETY